MSMVTKLIKLNLKAFTSLNSTKMKGKKTSFLAQQIYGTKMLGDTCNACKN